MQDRVPVFFSIASHGPKPSRMQQPTRMKGLITAFAY